MSNIFHIGIDLGTSQTSIATSTGKRLSTTTCVGYAKDVISKKRFGKDYLIGNQALENRLSLNMIWPLADGVIRDNDLSLEATVLILKDIINESLTEKQEGDKIYAAIGVPAQASIINKKAIIDATKDFIDKIIIVSEPFSVAYSIDRFDECLIVDIGGGTTDLCRMHGSMPDEDDQVTLNFAGNFLDQELTKAILNKFPDVQLSTKIIKNIKEKYGYVSDVSDKVEVTLNTKGIPNQYDITDILRESCLKLTTFQVQKSAKAFSYNF